MKKNVTMLIAVSMVLVLFMTGCLAIWEKPATGSESEMVNGQLCFWNNVENSPVAMFTEDGSLSVAWNRKLLICLLLFHTTVPVETLEQIPSLADGSLDLLYIVKNTNSLKLSVSVVSVDINTPLILLAVILTLLVIYIVIRMKKLV